MTSNIILPNGEGWVIGIGASAGGLEALTLLISNLPADFRSSIIIAQHLAPHSKSMMVELLARHSRLPVLSAKDKDLIRAGTIYVVPPNHDIDIVDNHITLKIAGNETRPKPSVDHFFESLARAYGDRAVGVILSGTGTDGSDGIQAIKAAGGLTVAQDEESAKYDGMPKSAINTGNVDSILSPDQMARNFPEILAEHETRLKFRTLDTREIEKILELIKEKDGTDFRQYKMSSISRRLIRRMAALNIASFDKYYDLLLRTPGEITQLAQEMLISVTCFFRDKDVFQSLTPYIETVLAKKHPGDEVRVWVAGCATGEEAYTLAIIFAEAIERQKTNLLLKIFATDLDHDAIFDARNGVYSPKDVESVPLELRRKYFDQRNENFEVSKRLRECVVFARQNMIQNPPFVKLDLVSCRNVLIYFESELQKKIIETFHYSLLPHGVLLLGKSESVAPTGNIFATANKNAKIFSKVEGVTRTMPIFRKSYYPHQNIETKRKIDTGPSLAETSYLRLLKAYGLSGVVVDDEANVLQIIGDVSNYLGFFNPQVDFRLSTLLPKGIGIEVPILIRKASKDGGVHKSRVYKINRNGKSISFNINVRPLFPLEEGPTKTLYLVNFRKVKAPKPESKVPTLNESEMPARMAELEHELFVTREHLQTLIEELGVSNEELQSLNEELSSTNEELQASGEELETTNEELQSSNEELTTLNEELVVKSNELKLLNVSFENVENSITSPMLILDARKRVVRFNPETSKVFRISGNDIGREISRVSSNFELDDFDEQLNRAIRDGQASEMTTEVGSTIYQVRILPSLDENQSIIGAIVIFNDYTTQLRAQEKIRQSELRLKSIINGAESIVSMKDALGRYILVNEAFQKFFNLAENEILGKTDRELFPDSIAMQFRDADLEVLLKGKVSKKQESLVFPDGNNKHLLSSRFPMAEERGLAPYAVGVVSADISEQVRMQEELKLSEARYRSIVEDQSVYVCRFSEDGSLSYINQSFAHLFEMNTLSDQTKKFEQVVAAEDWLRIKNEILSINQANPTVQMEHRMALSSHKPRWVRWIMRGFFNLEGQVTEYQAVGFDVSETRHKTDQLLEKDAIYSSVFNYTIDFLTIFQVCGDDFIIESFNRSVAKIWGASNGQLIGENLRNFTDSSKIEDVLARYQRCVQTRNVEIFDDVLETPGGVRQISTTLVPIPGPSGNIERVAALSRDVSVHKKIENDLRRAKTDAEIANRSKSDFLASMSHELRTPLNVVLGMAQLLGDTQLSNDQKSFANSIERSGKVLLSLIEDILDVSRIEAGMIKLDAVSFNLAELVADVIEIFKPQTAKKNVALEAKITPKANCNVIGDPTRLRQVLVNLIGNSIKFTDQGSIVLEVAEKIGVSTGENSFEFSVTDTGIGIAEEDHHRLFQRFSQVDTGSSRRFGGTGLGLMISKHLVALMGGEIGFESTYGSGSRFFFHVPLAISRRQLKVSEKNRDASPNSKTVNLKPLSILAVDASPDNRTLIGLFLEKLGHKVELAELATEALQMIQKKEFDLVLMDVQMPEMDGYAATTNIRKLPAPKNEIPVIALTANAMSKDADQAFQAGMNDYLTKPIRIENLRDMLKKWQVKISLERGH